MWILRSFHYVPGSMNCVNRFLHAPGVRARSLSASARNSGITAKRKTGARASPKAAETSTSKDREAPQGDRVEGKILKQSSSSKTRKSSSKTETLMTKNSKNDDVGEDEMIDVGCARQSMESRSTAANEDETEERRPDFDEETFASQYEILEEDDDTALSEDEDLKSAGQKLVVNYSAALDMSRGKGAIGDPSESLEEMASKEGIVLPGTRNSSWEDVSEQLLFDEDDSLQGEELDEEYHGESFAGNEEWQDVDSKTEETTAILKLSTKDGYKAKARYLWTLVDHIEAAPDLATVFNLQLEARLKENKNDQSVLALEKLFRHSGFESGTQNLSVLLGDVEKKTVKTGTPWTEREDIMLIAGAKRYKDQPFLLKQMLPRERSIDEIRERLKVVRSSERKKTATKIMGLEHELSLSRNRLVATTPFKKKDVVVADSFRHDENQCAEDIKRMTDRVHKEETLGYRNPRS
ncbi:hypothetical protein NDN08_001057 [Rhodosorus marinus]|uniref:Myb-like domain-containing protein n=1 Tax=Rhodosorus marinus TaxID=101924 RepID=A0AAV8UR92_9RHOD|nr:hypothetical protein NDN08_001057 [Rhodosorus marinus]